jgi:hypothetical protein
MAGFNLCEDFLGFASARTCWAFANSCWDRVGVTSVRTARLLALFVLGHDLLCPYLNCSAVLCCAIALICFACFAYLLFFMYACS